MATIKDVAKLAQVSIGTVSNVINGKTQNEMLIQRVEEAMDQLGFRPVSNARSLKNTKSRLIGILLPDALQAESNAFLNSAEVLLREKGFNILLKFSGNNAILEKKCLQSFVDNRVEGVILYQTGSKGAMKLINGKKIPSVWITRNPSSEFRGDKVVIDYKDAFKQLMVNLTTNGRKKVALVLAKEILTADGILEIYGDMQGSMDLVKFVDGSKEAGFKAFFELYHACQEIDAVIAGNQAVAQGIRKAAKILEIPDFPIAVFKESIWIEDVEDWFCQISVSQKEVANNAIWMLLDSIEMPNLHEHITKQIFAKCDENQSMFQGITESGKILRFAMYDCPSARSLEMLTRIYERVSGIKIVFDFYSFGQLEEILYQQLEEHSEKYDGFMVDIVWMEGLVETGNVLNLDVLFEEQKEYFDGFIEGVLHNFAMYYESLYGIPFVSGAQLLFYQKDLFEDQTLQIRFKRKYGIELAPPDTWAKFHLVSEFFTQEYTPQSPVKYGASLIKGENVSLTCAFLNHLWAYGSDIFGKNGELVLNNHNSETALKNFISNYQYTSPRELLTWQDMVEEFCSGESAMTVLYDSYVGGMSDYTKSKVAGNVGCTMVPGSTPVLGGWNLCLNRKGKNQTEAIDFVLWACGAQNAIPLSLLGGSTLRKEYYERNDLEVLEPWKPYVLKSYEQSRKRIMPEIAEDSRWKNTIYTVLIPRQLMRVLKGEISEKEALVRMEEDIHKLLTMLQ